MAKIIISAKAMKPYYAKSSSVIKDLLAKGGGEILRRKIAQKEFWGELRNDSRSRAFGERGYTKKKLTDFFGGMLEDKRDRLTDRKVKKLADLFEIKRSKLYGAASDARIEQRKAREEEQKTKVESRNQDRQKQEAHLQQERQIHNHISEIIAKGHEKSQANLHSQGYSSPKHTDSYHAEEKTKQDFQENILTKFGVSESNYRKAEGNLLHSNLNAVADNDIEKYGHVLYRKNTQHDFVEEEETEAEKIKARLARIQGQADNKDIKIAV